MGEKEYFSTEDMKFKDDSNYFDVFEKLSSMVPEVARPLLNGARNTFKTIEETLYSAPAFVNLVKSSIPEEVLKAVISDEQKEKLASGALKLMTKKDGTLMANLIDPETKKIVSTIPLQTANLSPELSQAMTNYATQMQMAQIAEQIQLVQFSIEEVRQGQEYDRLAIAYSCQQKLLQAMEIKNSELKAMALLQIASDAEDSRNMLMLSQSANLAFIMNQPDSFFGKMTSGAKQEKIDQRMNEIRDSLAAVSMASLAEAMAYQEMGESAAACRSLQYYAEFIEKAYLSTEGLVERLDLIDSSPNNYWSKTLPDITKKIHALPYFNNLLLTGGEENNGEQSL